MRRLLLALTLAGMKPSLLLCCLLALTATVARAQDDYPATPAPADTATVPARYQQVVAVPGVGADELYARAREWVALTFEDMHQAVQLDEAQRHLLIGSGYTLAYSYRPSGKVKNTVPLWFRFRLETRDGRYRLELTDFGSTQGFYSGQYASNGIGHWLASSHATRQASARHSAPGETMTALIGDGSLDSRRQVKTAIEQATVALFASLRQVATAVPATW